jgi:hypothetical protein
VRGSLPKRLRLCDGSAPARLVHLLGPRPELARSAAARTRCGDPHLMRRSGKRAVRGTKRGDRDSARHPARDAVSRVMRGDWNETR